MLQRGMMGSDISYEDMMESEGLESKYTFKLLPDSDCGSVKCYSVELTVKVKDANYARQVLHVDKNYFIPMKIELYARGGRLVKTMVQGQVKKSGTRYVAHRVEIQDQRRKNSRTENEQIENSSPM